MTAPCARAFHGDLEHLMLGNPCPDCGHSPLVHTTTGCSVCLALDAARRAEAALR